MKKILFPVVITALVIAGLVVPASASNTVYSINVVGYYKLTAESDPGSDVYTFLAAPMTKIPVYRGVITANTSNEQGVASLTDAAASWTVGQYDEGVTNPVDRGFDTFYVEISGPTNAPYLGRYYYISNNTANALVITGCDWPTNNCVTNCNYKIIPANRIRRASFADLCGQRHLSCCAR